MRHPAPLIAFICVMVTKAFAQKEAPPPSAITPAPAVAAPAATAAQTNSATSATTPTPSPAPATSADSAAVSEKSASASNSWKALILPREEIPDDRNALTRWRPSFDRLQPDTIETSQLLQNLTSPIEDAPAIDDPTLRKWLTDVAPLVKDLVIRDGESLQLPVLRGPETPFPDHAPLRQLATVRAALMKAAWLDGRTDEAVNLAIENLRLARAFYGSQEGIIGLIQATGVWQISLDGIYWLGRQETLTPDAAAHLQNELIHDDRLASAALVRAFRGEFTFFTHLVIERLPKTKDVNVLLGGIATLGMSTPEPTDPNELHLATPERDPFDREATLQLSADDIAGWIAAFAKNRHPSGLMARHTAPQLQAYAKEIEPLLRSATEDAAPTLESVTAANQTVASVQNSVGKLFLVITTSKWEPLSTHVFRREAERGALVGLLAQRRIPNAPALLPVSAASAITGSAANPTTVTTPPAAESTPSATASPLATAPSVQPNTAALPIIASTESSPPTAPTPMPAATTVAEVNVSAPPTAATAVAPRFLTWEKLIAAKLLSAPPADPFTAESTLHLDVDPLQPRIWSVGENGIDDGGQGSGENVGLPLDLTWPMR